MQENIRGLTSAEAAAQRKADGEGAPETTSRSVGTIVKDNVFTLFNLLNVLIAAMLFAVGAYSNMAFFGIIVLNTAIGIVQEIKAKKLVDELSVLNRPRARVLRDGSPVELAAEEIVRGDVMLLESGRQVCRDAVVLSGCVEVNESLLTGESDAVVKREGDRLLSGSAIVSGRCEALADCTGRESYAAALSAEVKQEKRVDSELLGSMRKVTKFTSMLIVPMGAALLAEALVLRGEPVNGAVVSSSAALLGMLPKGLVLLISVSLAMGAARLAKRKILVQNIFALESLAHTDVLCLDKTGTITTGELAVTDALPLSANQKAKELLRAYLAATYDNNATVQALQKAFPSGTEEKKAASHVVLFSSARKWGAVSFGAEGTVFVGAPERLLKVLPAQAAQALAAGNRLLAAAYFPNQWKSDDTLPPLDALEPLYLFILTDTIREGAAKTLAYFAAQGVEVKVISGDHVQTVAQVARRAGLARWKQAIDLSTVDETSADYEALSEKYAVFARVTPQQKKRLVEAMQKRGHKVAMTGDGVNDLPALRQADCSVAVAAGSDASRQLAQVVLLESDFTHLPQVVEEGRRVIHNVTRTAGVFFIKTIYSLLLSAFCLAANALFPFIPLQITLIDAFIEALPSFATVFEADRRPVRGHFLPSALGNALPFALVITSTVIFAGLSSLQGAQLQTVQYLLLVLFSLTAVVHSCVPFTPLRAAVCAVSAGGIGAALALLGRRMLGLVPFTSSMSLALLASAALGAVLLLILKVWAAANGEDKKGFWLCVGFSAAAALLYGILV